VTTEHSASESKFAEQIADHERRTAKALAMGGPAKLKRRHDSGVLNARERLDYLLDAGSWSETGLFATSARPEQVDETPTDGKITGFGRIGGRQVAAVAYDFTVKGSSSSSTSNRKMAHVKAVSKDRGFPMVYLGESTGIRMPDTMGGTGMGNISSRERFLRARETPWVSAVFGFAFGSAAWHAVAADFNVIRKGAVMAVSSPKLVRMATGRDISAEELGGWAMHAQVTGFADAVADTDEQALDLVAQFLSYLPGNSSLPAPRLAVPDGSNDAIAQLLEFVPESPRQVYDVRKVINAVVDAGSFFEIKAMFATNATTGLARIDGRSVGVIANNPMFKVGSLDANACDKITSFVVLCDSFNIPLVFLVDQPGFLVGPDAEAAGIVGKVINWMQALAQCSVPIFTVIMRKSYGQAYVNMGAGGMADQIAAWWTADVSFMSPSSAARIVYGIDPAAKPDEYERRLAEMSVDNSAYSLASNYGAQDVIDPRDTRSYLTTMLDVYDPQGTGAVGKHLLAGWPSSFC
jgi:acetyl-CoA carboxylase carboxyltransferase component